MRTTLNLNDELAHQAKILAVREKRTFTSVIEDALRAELVRVSEVPQKAKRKPLPLIEMVFPDNLDTSDNSAVLDYLDEIDGPPRR